MSEKNHNSSKKALIGEKQLKAYAIAAGAFLAAAATADATVIYSQLQDITLNSINTQADIDIDGNGAEFRFTFNSSNNFTYSSYGSIARAGNVANYPGNLLALWANDAATGGIPAVLPSGTSINSSKPWNQANGTLFYYNLSGYGTGYSGNFGSSRTGYLGIKFGSLANPLYGWIFIDDVAPDYSSYHIAGWGYEDSGTPIAAGDTGAAPVPEPATLSLLAMGAAGLFAMRRKKRS